MPFRNRSLLAAALTVVRTPRRAAVAAFLLGFPTLFTGFALDDHIHLLTLDGNGYGATAFDLFTFGSGNPEQMAGLINGGPYPWYTLPSLKIRFFRPLSSLLMQADRRLFGEFAIAYHVHSVLWYGLLAWGAALVYRRALGGLAAFLAMLLFVLDETHLIPTLWWSNRNALVAAAPAVLGLVAHLRWREDGWRPGLPLSLAGYAVGLAGGEGALGILGYVLAYEVFARQDGWKVRVGAFLPGSLLAGIYLLFYKCLGYGVSGSGIYLDPVSEWRTFLSYAPGRLADLAGIQFFGLPTELAVASNEVQIVFRVLSLAAVVVAVAVFWQLWRRLSPEERRSMGWLGAGALLATVPCLATFPSGRLLTLPSLGACAGIALVIRHGFMAMRSRGSWVLWSGARVFLVVNVLMAPVIWLGLSTAAPVVLRLADGAFALEGPVDETMDDRWLFCLYATDPYTGMYPAAIWRRQGHPEPLGWQCFSVAPFAHEVSRVAENSFEVKILEGELLSTPFERLMRSPSFPLAVGEMLHFEAYTVTILETGVWGPSCFRVTTHASLEDERYQFLAWEAGELATFKWPPVGASVVLRPEDGYFAWGHFKKRLSLL